MFKNYTINRLLVLTATCGFGFLLADTIIEHFNIFKQEILAYIPVIFSLIGLIAGVLTVYKWKSGLIKLMHYVFILSFLVAAAGFYIHLAEELEEEPLTTEEKLHEANENDKPLLAPFGFGGIGAFGLLGTSRKWKSELKEKRYK